MRQLPPGLADHLGGGATTLARCWTLTRADGVALGFTDHDEDLAFDGVVHRAATGVEAAEANQGTGFAASSHDIVGVLRSAGVTEADIAAGRYDAGDVTVWLVNWRAPEQRLRLGRYVIGEISRSEAGFVVELRSEAHRHDEERGRLYTRRCDADLGDARCGAPVTPSAGVVQAMQGSMRLICAGLGDHAAGEFSGGRLRFLGGRNAGVAVEIREHATLGEADVIDVWLEPPHEVEAGDPVSLTPGCDKRFQTCRDRFGNAANFRGFPHMPGNDVLLQRAGLGPGRRLDGGSLFR